MNVQALAIDLDSHAISVTDKKAGTFTKTKLSDVSAGRIAVGQLMHAEGVVSACRIDYTEHRL